MVYRLYAYGSNGEGQLGLGRVDDKVFGAQVENPPPCLEEIESICGGGNHTLMRTRSGHVWGAGCNLNKQLLGISDREQDVCSPVLEFKQLHCMNCVTGCAAAWESSAYALLGPVLADLGAFTTIYTSGRGLQGELGRGPAVEVHPTTRSEQIYDPLPGIAGDIAAGMYHYVAVVEPDSVYGWGRSKNGQLGKTEHKSISQPTLISDVPFWPHRVACGQNFTYIVGYPGTGEHLVLGEDKHGLQSDAPFDVKGWKDIGATWNAIFVLFEDGSLKAWGKSNLWSLVPPNLPPLEQIAVGSDHIVAITRDGKVISWGWAVHGNCGPLDHLKKPLGKGYVTGQWNEIPLDGKPVKIGAGYSTTFVITKTDEPA
ncbi:RCC1/BLIP-II [Sporormia fimetaria CBS 119925]|uniref:RCC1/BLIP-II n=1 Tax=Sporormia fimetaria CBS 119925 TaxID=1340428 RepID=A0A6A6VG06_9PLEO|nr:RCC1/BLIP-II [Sporormia fimetaria CBS 119925]